MSFIKSLRGYLSLRKKIKSFQDTKKVIFYSESKNYRNYLISIFKSLESEKKISLIYLTSDQDDKDKLSDKHFPIYIGDGFLKTLVLNLIDCDMAIMTLTDLNNHAIKRSQFCPTYVYLFHSLVSTHKAYTKNAFNNYDIILSNGDYQKKEIEYSEKLYNLKKKKIYTTGYPYLELLKDYQKKFITENTILFAPSWGVDKKNLFNDYSINIIDLLIKNNQKVILRTHPELIKRSNKIMDNIYKKYKNNKLFELNKDLSDLKPIFNSSLLITDNGGTALEYFIIQKKPVVYINYIEKIHNEKFQEIKLETIEDVFKKELGFSVDIENLDNLNSYLVQAKRDFNLKKDKIEKLIMKFDIIMKNQTMNVKKTLLENLGFSS